MRRSSALHGVWWGSHSWLPRDRQECLSHRILAPALAILLLCAVLLSGCRREPPTRVTIRGGPSLAALFAELAQAYERQYPGSGVVTDFTCPPCRMLSSPGAPLKFDLFASLGEFELQRLRELKAFTAAEQVPIGTTHLVLVTSKHASAAVTALEDLRTARLRRIGIGDPENIGVGHYTRQALRKLKLWEELKPRFVSSQSGCELLKWLGLGREVDAAFVFSLCLADEAGAVQQVVEFPADVAPPVPVLLAVSQTPTDPAEARRFIEFVRQSPEILLRHRVQPLPINGAP